MKIIGSLLLALLVFCNFSLASASVADKKQIAEYLYSAADYESTGDYANALVYYGKAVAADPKDTFALQKRAELYLRLGEVKSAIADYTTAIRQWPHSNLYINRGAAYYRSGLLQKALADYTVAIELDGSNTNAWFNRGVLYHKMQRYEQAIADFTELIALQPEHSRNFTIRAGLYFESGDLQRALRDCSSALAIDPETPAYYHNRAEVLRRLGRSKEAEADEVKADYLLRKEQE